MNPKIKDALNNYARSVVSEMRTRLTGFNKIATGKLSKSLRGTVKEESGNPVVEFSMVSYGYYVDKGRKPGKMPPVSKIKKWCKIKGISELAAFPIARAIGNRGIPATNFFTISINRRKKQLTDTLKKIIKEDLK